LIKFDQVAKVLTSCIIDQFDLWSVLGRNYMLASSTYVVNN